MDARRTRILALVGGMLVACLVYTVRCLPTWDTVVDDAYISARYADQFAAGNGLVFNAGQPPVEGYTNLVWTVSLGVLRWLGAPAHEAMIWMGYLWGLVGLVAMVLVADVLFDRDRLAWLPAVPALLLAAMPHYAIVSTNGLETSQFIAWTLVALWATWASTQMPSRIGAAAVLGTLSWVRPEGALVAAGIVLIDLIERRASLRQAATWAPAIGTVLGLVVLFVWRWVTYAALLPNTGIAKANLSWWGALKLNAKHLGMGLDFWIGVAVALLIGALLSRWSWKKVLLLCLFGGLVAVASRVYLWMPGGRLLVLPVALVLPVIVAPLQGMLTRPRWRWAKVGWAVLIGGFFLVYTTAGRPTRHERGRDERHSVVSPNDSRTAGEHVAAHLPDGAWLATRDAGLLAWSVGTRINVCELHPRALTQPHPGGADTDWHDVCPDDPEFVAFTVNHAQKRPFYYDRERRIWGSWSATYQYLGRVEQHHRRHYDLYVRADLGVPPLPPEIVTNFVGRISRTTVSRAAE